MITNDTTHASLRFKSRRGMVHAIAMAISVAPSLYLATMQLAHYGLPVTLQSILPFLIGATVTVWNIHVGALLLTAIWFVTIALPYCSDTLMLLIYTYIGIVPPVSVIPVLTSIIFLANENWLLGVCSAAICALATIPSSLHMSSEVSYDLGGALRIGAAFILFLFFALIGISWRLHDEHELRKREQQLLARQRDHLTTANQLHNSICNDLTYLLFITSGKDQHDPDIIETQETIRHTLTDVRAMIAELEHDTQEIGDSLSVAKGNTNHDHDDRESWDELQSAITKYDRRLSALRMSGGTMLSLSYETWTRTTIPVRNFVITTLDEIYGNMIKYANRKRGWCVSLRIIDGTTLRIEGSNAIRNDTDSLETVLSGHSGLARLRESAIPLGGKVQTSSENGRWLCIIDIPLAANRSQ